MRVMLRIVCILSPKYVNTVVDRERGEVADSGTGCGAHGKGLKRPAPVCRADDRSDGGTDEGAGRAEYRE